MLAYFIYSNLRRRRARLDGEGQRRAAQLGLWWVHLLPLVLAAWLVWRDERPGPLWRRSRAKAT